MQSQRQANVFLLIATIIWGITPIVVEELLGYMTPIRIMTIRFGVAVLILTVYIILVQRREGLLLLSSGKCVVIGLINALAYPAAAIGVQLTSAGLATLLSSSFIIIIPFISWKIEQSNLTLEIIGMTLVSLFGLFLISYNGDWGSFSSASYLGIITSILAAVLWGFSIVLSSKFLDVSREENNHNCSLNFIYAINFYTFLPLFIFTFLTSDLFGSFPGKIIPLLLFLGVLPTIVAFGLYSWAIARIGSINTSFYLVFQVLVPFLFEFLVIQRYYTIWIYFGTLLILLAMLFISKRNDSLALPQLPPNGGENLLMKEQASWFE